MAICVENNGEKEEFEIEFGAQYDEALASLITNNTDIRSVANHEISRNEYNYWVRKAIKEKNA